MTSTQHIRDTKSKSRKGRPAVSGVAMTPAERKRKQRHSEREAKSRDPSWLRLRKTILAELLERHSFADVDELVKALEAVAVGLSLANVWQVASPENALRPLLAIAEPEQMADHFGLFPEVMPYAPDREQAEKYPSTIGRTLIQFWCDISERHESTSEDANDDA